jgi:cation transport protein ChaC
MQLTAQMVARVQRKLEDPGPVPGLAYHTDPDYAAAVDRILAAHPKGEDIWLFAYGSLIWKPEVDHTEERLGIARGWHRSFCLRLTRWRGTIDQPGLMMTLDRGGQCKGVAYRLPETTAELQLNRLFRREMTTKPPSNMPRWITVEIEGQSVRALGFVANRKGPGYTGRLPLEAVAERLSRACGHWGSGAEYLYNTVVHLEERGIRDRNLWRLQRLVAVQIDAETVDPTSP